MSQLREILEGKGQSLVPQLHLQQVGLFLWRRGIELLPLVDDDARSRKKFLDDLWVSHKVPLYFTDIWEKGAKTGEVLLYMRPYGNGYSFLYYDKSQFDPYYDNEGRLSRVDIHDNIRQPGESRDDIQIDRHIRLGRDAIEVWEGRDMNFEPDMVIDNPYGFIPAVVVQNKPTQDGRGITEFENLEGQLEQHDWQIDQIHGNVEFFGGPIYYSSRSKSEMVEAGLVNQARNSFAEEGGYGYTRSQDRIKARRVISGMEEGEQIGFATPTAIDGNTLDFIERYEAQLRFALGSIPDRFVPGDFVAGDMDVKTKYAPVIATATRRAESYITYGLVELYRIALRMAVHDKFLADVGDDHVNWRYTGDVFPDTPNSQLTRSIVSRNLIRLGVNLENAIQHIFPDMREEEIEKLLEGGFAYELLNGVSQVGAKFDPESDKELINILKAVITAEVSKSNDRRTETTVTDSAGSRDREELLGTTRSNDGE